MSTHSLRFPQAYETETPRAFSFEQLEIIEQTEMACAKAGCDDNGHVCFIVD